MVLILVCVSVLTLFYLICFWISVCSRISVICFSLNFLWLLGLFSVCPCVSITLSLFIFSLAVSQPSSFYSCCCIHWSLFLFSILTFLFQSVFIFPSCSLTFTFFVSVYVSLSHIHTHVGFLALLSLFGCLISLSLLFYLCYHLVGLLASCACLMYPSLCSSVCFVSYLVSSSLTLCLYLCHWLSSQEYDHWY